MERFEANAGDASIVLLAVCQGLEGEAEAVREAIESLEPGTVALALAPGLVSHVPEFASEGRLGIEDAAYHRGLSRWGTVELPPPEFDAALQAAQAVDATVEGVDLPEEEYLDAFTQHVGILDLTWRALRTRWLKFRPPNAEDPRAFCRVFDAAVNKGPFSELEAMREAHMAKKITSLAQDAPVALVVEVQRVDGILEALNPGSTDPL